MRTVTLELLRHGPSHNQLLSPLTPYLALCENHAPVTVNVPFEHNQFLHRLSALAYELGSSAQADNQRQFQLQDTGRELSRILSAIPGLTAELNRAGADSANEVIHLRLVLSASELALLPFELVLAGNGFPGFGQPLLLQNQAPICLTREVRRVKDPSWPWTSNVRVLFVCARPTDLPPIPAEAHMLALRKAVAPWVRYFAQGDDDARRESVSECLDVLPAASIDDIQKKCAEGEYTHVHILAHGVSRREQFDYRYGIALHDPVDASKSDVVSGDRLASALRALERPRRSNFARPLVVTLASCNGANTGTVVGAGGSVAHALQVAGVPLVIAGQFPLSFEGSVELVQTLYEGLLWGTDPRALLMDLRRRMYVLQPEGHDWAALTSYASLPTDFDEQLSEIVISRARTALEAAMDHADSVLNAALHGNRGLDLAEMEGATTRIEEPWQHMRELTARLPGRRFELNGLMASLCKRRAEVLLAATNLVQMTELQEADLQAQSRELLKESRERYRECYEERPDATWAVVQFISLSLVLDGTSESSSSSDGGADLRRLWVWAYTQSRSQSGANDERAGWALGNLVELPLLAVLLGIERNAWLFGEGESWEREAAERVNELIARAESFHYQDYSTYRQLGRYYWFVILNPQFADIAEVAGNLALVFPPKSRGLPDV